MTPTLKVKGRSKKTGRRNKRVKKKRSEDCFLQHARWKTSRDIGTSFPGAAEQDWNTFAVAETQFRDEKEAAKSCLGTKKTEEGDGVPSMFGRMPKETANQRDGAI